MKTSSIWLSGLALCAVLGLSACNSAAKSELAEPGPELTTEATTSLITHPGKLLASNCFQCHGTNGQNGAFDSLAGESVSEIIGEMSELKTENDLDKAIMKVHALGYTDAQVRLIADYFSKVR